MKKLLAAMLGLAAFVAFAFQSPDSKKSKSKFQDDTPLVITLDGIEDGGNIAQNTGIFLAETD